MQFKLALASLAVGAAFGSTRLWSRDASVPIPSEILGQVRTIRIHEIAITPDGRCIAFTTADAVAIVSLQSQSRSIKWIPRRTYGVVIEFSRDGRSLGIADEGGIAVLDVNTYKFSRTTQGRLPQLPETLADDLRTVRLESGVYDVSSKRFVAQDNSGKARWAMSKDGTRIARMQTVGTQTQIRAFQSKGGKMHAAGAWTAARTDGDPLGLEAGSHGTPVFVRHLQRSSMETAWHTYKPGETKATKLRPKLEGHERVVPAPNGKWVCLYGYQGIEILEIPSQRHLGRFMNHAPSFAETEGVWRLCFAGNSSRIAYISNFNKIRVLELPSLRVVFEVSEADILPRGRRKG